MPVSAEVHKVQGTRIVQVPAVERAATIVHRGAMSQVLPTVQHLVRWIEDNGHRTGGYTREVTLSAPDDLREWVTEIQAPLA